MIRNLRKNSNFNTLRKYKMIRVQFILKRKEVDLALEAGHGIASTRGGHVHGIRTCRCPFRLESLQGNAIRE